MSPGTTRVKNPGWTFHCCPSSVAILAVFLFSRMMTPAFRSPDVLRNVTRSPTLSFRLADLAQIVR